MYTPPHFDQRDVRELHGMIESHPFGAFITRDGPGLAVDHIPFLLHRDVGPHGQLRAHVARANPLWRQLSPTTEAVVVFQGPHGYVSPTWLPARSTNRKAVPTWNYAVVHVFGPAKAIVDRDWLLAHVTELSTRFEARQQVPWRPSDAPADHITALLGAIVGIEIDIARLEGKWKLSQNRSPADQASIVAHLDAEGRDEAAALAALMRRAVR